MSVPASCPKHTAARAVQATLRCSKSTCSQSQQERTIDERVKSDRPFTAGDRL
jgi:hypothetical protein